MTEELALEAASVAADPEDRAEMAQVQHELHGGGIKCLDDVMLTLLRDLIFEGDEVQSGPTPEHDRVRAEVFAEYARRYAGGGLLVRMWAVSVELLGVPGDADVSAFMRTLRPGGLSINSAEGDSLDVRALVREVSPTGEDAQVAVMERTAAACNAAGLRAAGGTSFAVTRWTVGHEGRAF